MKAQAHLTRLACVLQWPWRDHLAMLDRTVGLSQRKSSPSKRSIGALWNALMSFSWKNEPTSALVPLVPVCLFCFKSDDRQSRKTHRYFSTTIDCLLGIIDLNFARWPRWSRLPVLKVGGRAPAPFTSEDVNVFLKHTCPADPWLLISCSPGWAWILHSMARV